MCDFFEKPPDPADTCFVANSNLARAERDSRSSQPGAVAKASAWNGTTRPRYLDRVDAHLRLTDEEHARLRANGFVVLDRLPYPNYAAAFHDIYQQQLPLYVGIDPILHAVFKGTEAALQRVERARLQPALRKLLVKLRNGLRRSKTRYASNTLRDLDLFLGVAWALGDFAPEGDPSAGLSQFGNDDAVQTLAGLATTGQGLVTLELFGRSRVVDFSQLVPRGHYADNGSGNSLSSYFQSVMWLSRLEFNLVSRSCRSSQPGESPDPRETPREARDAMALAELVSTSGAAPELAAFEKVYSAFAGRREDVSPASLVRLMRTHKITAVDLKAPERLRQAVGNRFRRTARTHFMPHGSTELPAIATLFGPRIVPDVAPLTRLVHDAVPDRLALGAADVGYVLGHDRAEPYLASDLTRHRTLRAALEGARRELAREASRDTSVYGSWLRGILALSESPAGAVPSFMRREAYADSRLNSALVGFAQLRHAFVLLAAQGYDAFGCEIPDGYVEPLPAVYDALVAHVRRLQSEAPGWKGLARVLRMLRSIVGTELRGAELSEPERRWLAMVAENVPGGGYFDSGAPPKWTGWYFDMFEDREHGAASSTALVADYFTLTNLDAAQHLGADGPRLGVFIVDAGGEPRAMVGPVATGYEARTRVAERLDDVRALTFPGKKAAWRDSFAVAPAPEPPVGLEGRVVRCQRDGSVEWRVVMRSNHPASAAEVTLLDHHGDPLSQPLRVAVGPTWQAHVFELSRSVAESRYGVEAMHVHIDAPAWDHVTSPSVFQQPSGASSALPIRPTGVGAFRIGAASGP